MLQAGPPNHLDDLGGALNSKVPIIGGDAFHALHWVAGFCQQEHVVVRLDQDRGAVEQVGNGLFRHASGVRDDGHLVAVLVGGGETEARHVMGKRKAGKWRA